MLNKNPFSPLLALAAVSLVACSLFAASPSDEEVTEEPLDPQLLGARKVLLLDTTMDFALSSSFRNELEEWGRFEIVFTHDEADVCMALSTRPDYTQEEIDSGGDEAEEDDPLSGRTLGTMRVMDTLYFKVFVPGGDELWTDKVDLDESTEAAKTLVERLRERMDDEPSDAAGAP